MNIATLNVCGFGEAAKRSWVKRLKISMQLNFVCIQETQITDFSNIVVKDCWDNDDFCFDEVNACGRSGGCYLSGTIKFSTWRSLSKIGITSLLEVYGQA